VSYELDAIAAVVIGGTSLNGGKGSVWGTVIGAVIIGVLNNGLVLLNVSPFWQQVVKGSVILLAVIIDKIGDKKRLISQLYINVNSIHLNSVQEHF
jgi:ribose transport system permease protein